MKKKNKKKKTFILMSLLSKTMKAMIFSPYNMGNENDFGSWAYEEGFMHPNKGCKK